MPLAIEPLHPMYAADRACINTLEQALDVCDALDPQRAGALGVAVDLYHVWWDPKLQAQIERAGRDRLLALPCVRLADADHRPAERSRHDGRRRDRHPARARLGRSAGFAGYSEVEIFSARNWWQRDGDEVLDTCIERHRRCV